MTNNLAEQIAELERLKSIRRNPHSVHPLAMIDNFEAAMMHIDAQQALLKEAVKGLAFYTKLTDDGYTAKQTLQKLKDAGVV